MKAIKCCFLFLITSIVFFSCASVSKKAAFDESVPFYSEKVEYEKISTPYFNKEIAKPVEYINVNEFEKDLMHLKYIIKTCYAGYFNAKEKGFNIDEYISKIKCNVEVKSGKVSVRDFQKEICSNISYYVSDSHMKVFNGNEPFWSLDNYDVYYSNTYLRKEGDGKFRIYITGDENLKVGKEYTGSSSNLFYYPARGNNVYRLGVVSDTSIKDFAFDFSSQKIKVPVYKEDAISRRRKLYTNHCCTQKTAYFSFSSFDTNENFEFPYEEIENKENIIIDLRSNGGGIIYPSLSVMLLNPKENASEYIDNLYLYYFGECIQFESPGIIQANHDYTVSHFPNNEEDIISVEKRLHEQKIKPQYNCWYLKDISPSEKTFKPEYYNDRKAILLIDRNTASASEMLVLLFKKIFKDVIVIGENSKGCLAYGGVYEYELPFSKLDLFLSSSSMEPFTSSFGEWKGEGKGIYPDEWATKDDLLETVSKACGDEQLKVLLKGLNSSLK